MRKIIFLLFLILPAAPLYALDKATPQVLIEPKILYVNDRTQRDIGADFAFVLTPAGDNQTKVEVSSLVTGRGADYRRWIPDSFEIKLPDGSRVLPVNTQKIYLAKPGVAAPIAPILFAAIGSQYEMSGSEAGKNPGKVCPVTGKPENTDTERGPIGKTIDRAGMAVGMGLLTGQAKGELEGRRATFLLNTPVTQLTLKTAAKHTTHNDIIMIITPVLVGERE